MTPGAGSSETAWLAILRRPGQDARVVRVDAGSGGLGGDGTGTEPLLVVAVEETDLTVPAQTAAVLLPDADGYVWLAARSEVGWAAKRIDPTGNGAGADVTFGPVPSDELPRYYLPPDNQGLTRTDGVLYTDRGFVTVPTNTPALPPAAPGQFRLDVPGLTTASTRPAGPWQPLFPRGAPVSTQPGAAAAADPQLLPEARPTFAELLRSPAWSTTGMPDTGWFLVTRGPPRRHPPYSAPRWRRPFPRRGGCPLWSGRGGLRSGRARSPLGFGWAGRSSSGRVTPGRCWSSRRRR